MCAFENGILRMVTITIETADNENNAKGDRTKLIQALKPHSMPINVMSLNTSCRYVLYKLNNCILKTIYRTFFQFISNR